MLILRPQNNSANSACELLAQDVLSTTYSLTVVLVKNLTILKLNLTKKSTGFGKASWFSAKRTQDMN